MHPHLHTKDNTGCEALMHALEECHARGFFHRVVGGCSATKAELNACLRAARLERTRANQVEARKRRDKIKAIWREIDEENS